MDITKNAVKYARDIQKLEGLPVRISQRDLPADLYTDWVGKPICPDQGKSKGRLIFIDKNPLANWGHQCEYRFVERATGEVTVYKSMSPPNPNLIMNDVSGQIHSGSRQTVTARQIRRQVIYRATDEAEEQEIMSRIHEQLAGNQDYIDCRIVLNDSATRNDGTSNEVHLYVFADSLTDPEITV